MDGAILIEKLNNLSAMLSQMKRKKERFIAEWQDGRSSLNDIGTYAHELGKKFLEG